MDYPLVTPPGAADILTGTVVPGTAGSFGSWLQLSAATSHEGVWVIFSVEVDGGGTSGVDLELGMGAAASEVSFCRVIASNNSTTSSSGGGYASFPIFIPEGTRVSARGACTGSTAPGNVRVRVTILY